MVNRTFPKGREFVVQSFVSSSGASANKVVNMDWHEEGEQNNSLFTAAEEMFK